MFLMAWWLPRKIVGFFERSSRTVLTYTVGLNGLAGFTCEVFFNNFNYYILELPDPRLQFVTHGQSSSTASTSNATPSPTAARLVLIEHDLAIIRNLKKCLATSNFLTRPFTSLNTVLSNVRWIPTSSDALDEAERSLFENVTCHVKFRFVPVLQDSSRVWSLVAKSKEAVSREPKSQIDEHEQIVLALTELSAAESNNITASTNSTNRTASVGPTSVTSLPITTTPITVTSTSTTTSGSAVASTIDTIGTISATDPINFPDPMDSNSSTPGEIRPVKGHRPPTSISAVASLLNLHERIPLLLLHGFGGGLGLWVKNLDSLCHNRTVYAMDLLGFGKSSRHDFGDNPPSIERQWVESIEDFRREMNIDRMIIVGHCLGGYLACAYALEYPSRVRHLILADPWGMCRHKQESARMYTLPGWAVHIANVACKFNPFASLRALGPGGPIVLRRLRPDFRIKYNTCSAPEVVLKYLYHCNAQPPSGECAFRKLTEVYGWAKTPMVERMCLLPKEMPITFIYGTRSWISNGPGLEVQNDIRTDCYVRVEMMNGAGHHVYADMSYLFNELVNETCDLVDINEDQWTPSEYGHISHESDDSDFNNVLFD